MSPAGRQGDGGGCHVWAARLGRAALPPGARAGGVLPREVRLRLAVLRAANGASSAPSPRTCPLGLQFGGRRAGGGGGGGRVDTHGAPDGAPLGPGRAERPCRRAVLRRGEHSALAARGKLDVRATKPAQPRQRGTIAAAVRQEVRGAIAPSLRCVARLRGAGAPLRAGYTGRAVAGRHAVAVRSPGALLGDWQGQGQAGRGNAKGTIKPTQASRFIIIPCWDRRRLNPRELLCAPPAPLPAPACHTSTQHETNREPWALLLLYTHPRPSVGTGTAAPLANTPRTCRRLYSSHLPPGHWPCPCRACRPSPCPPACAASASASPPAASRASSSRPTW